VYVFAGIRSPRDRQNLLDGAGVGDLQLRDLRRTAATNLAKLGISRFIVKRVLNHKDAEVTAIYDVYRYLPEVRAALDKWAATLSAIVAAPTSSSQSKRRRTRAA
jgi:integrase